MNYNEYISYSNIVFGSNEFVRSLEYAKKAITENPDAVEGYLCAGKACMSLDKYNEAIDFFKKALLKDKANGNAFFFLDT